MTKKNRFNQFALSLIMGVIIIAFVFTGVQSFTNNPDQLGDVDGTPITVGEYNRSLNRMLEFYAQMNQGKQLSQKEIRQRRVRETVFQQIVSQKMMLNFAKSMRFDAGAGAVKKSIITDYPNFQTGGQFDLNKYKAILKQNRISFKDFEENTIDQIKMKKLNELISTQLPSDTYVAEQLKFKNSVAKIMAITFEKEAMTEFLTVTDKGIEEFLAQSKSKAIIDSLYQTYKAKEGEKAKKLEEMKNELAASHIKRTKRAELKKFNETLKADLEDAFKANQWSKVKSIAKKYKLKLEDNSEINLLNPNIPGIKVDEEKLYSLLLDKNSSEVIVNDTPLTVSFVKAKSFEQKKLEEKEKEQFLSFAKNSMSRSLNFKILELQKTRSKVTQNMQL